MNGASATMPRLTSSGAGREHRTHSAFANLLSKELRESRAVIIVGLWSFWLMPVCIELLYILYGVVFDNHGDIASGVAWVALLVLGWLYAVVVGAHVVCRDWGKPEEHFLVSQPVSARSIIASKLLAGLFVVVGVALIAALWDLGLATFDEQVLFSRGFLEQFSDRVFAVSMAVVVTSIMAVGFLAAFAAAVVTRQMLTSVLVGVLVLLIWWAGPMLSRDLEILYPIWWHQDFNIDVLEGAGHNLLSGSLLCTGRAFLLLVAGAVAACVATALIAAPRERTIRVGHKTLAWAMAVVVLAMFGFAMNEVGTSLSVCDNVRLFKPGFRWGPRWGQRMDNTLFARQGEHCVVITTGYIYQRGEKDLEHVMPMISFRVDDTGKVHDLRRADLLEPGSDKPFPMLGDLLQLSLNEAGDFILTAVRWPWRAMVDKDLCRLRIRWPADREPEIVSQTVAGLSEEKQKEQEKLVLTSYASTDHWAYLVYATASIEPDGKIDWSRTSKQSWPYMLYIVDWTAKPEPKIIHQISVPPCTRVKVIDNMLFIQSLRQIQSRWHGKMAACPATDPAAVAEFLSHPEDEWWKAMKPEWRQFLQTDPWEHRDLRPKIWNKQQTAHFKSNWWGLRVMQYTDVNRTKLEEVGRFSVSPIGVAFRQVGRWGDSLKLIDDETLVELATQTLSLYDVSDLRRPRRLGFFHLAHNQNRSARVFTTDRHLLLLEGGHLTVLDRPRAAITK